MVEEHQLPERRACRLVGLSRDCYRHPPIVNAVTQALSARIVEIAHERRRFGYRRIHDLLRPQFGGINEAPPNFGLRVLGMKFTLFNLIALSVLNIGWVGLRLLG